MVHIRLSMEDMQGGVKNQKTTIIWRNSGEENSTADPVFSYHGGTIGVSHILVSFAKKRNKEPSTQTNA